MIIPDFLEPFFKTFSTESGLWHPLAWVIVAVVAFLIVYIIRSFGKNEYSEKTEQTKVFLSGNPEPEKDKMHVGGSNLYWGFMEMLSWVYKGLDKMHNGNVSDYILWFVIILGMFFVILAVI